MACPTCSHTMQRFNDGWYWCPRCGTLRQEHANGFRDDEAPMLVGRVRGLLAELGSTESELARLRGIEESVYLEELR